MLHWKTGLPQRHSQAGVQCGEEVDEGEENPHGTVEKEKLHADEMVSFH